MTYYLKYRPQKISELDIAEVRESLGKIVSSGKIPHAFLFSGPKGTGKTSAARILAKVVNCEKKGKEPCDKCETCLSIIKGNNIDVIELDAASNRGIDDIRMLRDAVKLSPAKAKKKVYIIDEVHMLTLGASNALLKTLEEPPSHVMFILATTNPEKLISTITSRTVNIPFKKASGEELVRSLGRVVKGEKIKIEKDSLASIAVFADGSFREAAKTLEQLVLEKKSLNKEKIEEYLFQRKVFDIESLLNLLKDKNTKGLLNEIQRIEKGGGSMENLTTALLGEMRSALLFKAGVFEGEKKFPWAESIDMDNLIYLIEIFAKAQREISDSPIEELPVEIAVIKWCSKDKEIGGNDQKDNTEAKTEEKESTAKQELKESIKESAATINASLKEVSEDVWRNILTSMRPVNSTIEALLRAARPIGFNGQELTLGVFYRFHKERLEEVVNKRILEDVVAKVLGVPARVVCTLTEPPKKEEVKPEVSEPVLTEGSDRDIIKIAEEIFGN